MSNQYQVLYTDVMSIQYVFGVVSFLELYLSAWMVALIWHLLTVLLCAPFPSQALDQPGQVQSIAILSALHLRRTMWSLNVQTIFSNVFFEVSFLISKLHKSSESHE